MRNVLFFFLIASSAVAFAGRVEIREGTVSYQQALGHDKLVETIIKAFVQRGWRIRERGNEHVLARLEHRRSTVDVKATWSDGVIHLTYVDSTNLDYVEKKGRRMIHGNYYKWITYLERDLTVFLNE
jgi:hypothetical protein